MQTGAQSMGMGFVLQGFIFKYIIGTEAVEDVEKKKLLPKELKELAKISE